MAFSDDELIEQLAVGQLGLVTRAQLQAHGLTTHAIAGRVEARRLRVLHRGVYRVGPVVAPYARELAAVLACGPQAVLSHRSAGWLWQLLPDPGNEHPVDISLIQGERGRRPNLRRHRARLHATEVTVRGFIPVTVPGRTVIDLAALLETHELEGVLARAERSGLLERGELLTVSRRPGAPRLRALLENDSAPALTRSEAERRFLILIRKAQLPAPETNARVGAFEVDFFWRRERLIVEVDGYAYHGVRRKFEGDRRRDALPTACV
jgi:hypothetical protein